jgi:membrane dipeptidase
LPLIIDSHLDLAWNAVSWRRDLTLPLDELNRREAAMSDQKARGNATVCLPEMRRGGVAVCLATVLARAVPAGTTAASAAARFHSQGATGLDFPSQPIAYANGQGQLAYYRALEQTGEAVMIRTRGELDAHWQRWTAANADTSNLPLGLILAMEGADPIITPAQADEWWHAGLRCASLVHYGRSAYAVGTGDNGPLTPAGRDMLRAFDRLGIILDVTHLSDESFFEALDHFAGALLASHNNCRALVPGDRQFSDEQLKRIIERGGVIGAALDAWMLHPGWKRGQTSRDVVPLSSVADHIDHVCQLAGNHDHAAIGSDLDGGFGREQTPAGLDSIADLCKLEAILASRGYDAAAIDAVFHGNWLRFLRGHLPV